MTTAAVVATATATANTSIDSRKFVAVNFFTALVENTLFYPFEFLKTRQQAVDVGSSFRPQGTPVGVE